MICVECTNLDIKCLYSQFKSKYIKLTVCEKCGKLADKYIEYDNVLLFLDVLLLKPQAYHHVAYNLVEASVFVTADDYAAISPKKQPSYRTMMRYFILLILFEVYLNWAYEEKNSYHSIMMQIVLQKSSILQYCFFITQLVIEKMTLCSLLYFMFVNLLGWGKNPNTNLPALYQRQYYISVLVVAVFMSLIVKCLPVIMLIWPYDNTFVALTVVDVMAVLTTIEALKMITCSSYVATSLIVEVATVALTIWKQLVMCYVVAFVEGLSGATLFVHELQHELTELGLLRDFARSFIQNFAKAMLP